MTALKVSDGRVFAFLLTSAALGGLAANSVSAGDAPRARVALEDVAGKMIESCVDYATQHKLTGLSIAIVDLGGTLVRFERMKGADPASVDAAILKAQSSARTRVPTAALATQDAGARDLFVLLKLTQIPGGVPVVRGEDLIGAVGVSGSLPAQDAACAQQAASAIKQ